MTRRVLLPTLYAILLFSLPNQPAVGIEGGEPALTENVVTFVKFDSKTRLLVRTPTCSGAMLTTRIVATAKHCITKHSAGRDLIDTSWEVTYPGVDVGTTNLATAKILEIIALPGDYSTIDDLAFVVIDRDFPVTENLIITTPEELLRLQEANTPTITLGYGGSADSVQQSRLPYKITNRLVKDFPDRSWFPYVFAIQYLNETAYICGGDSGGPNYALESGRYYYIGPTGFATRPGCARGLGSGFYSGGTAIAHQLDLFEQAENVSRYFRDLEAAKTQPAITPDPKEVKSNKIKKVKCAKGKVTKKFATKGLKCPTGWRKLP